MGIFSGLFNKENSGNSTTTNKTENIDQKQQLGDGSVGGTASGGGIVNIHTSDMGAIDSSFRFADSITEGTLAFAGANSDSAFKVVNATVDSAFKSIEASMAASARATAEASANAMHLANAATDSALRFGDSTVGQSFNFAKAITQGAAHDVAAAGSRADGITQDAMSAVKDAYADTGATLADAYTNAKAGEQKVMVAVALAILGLVAIKIMGK